MYAFEPEPANFCLLGMNVGGRGDAVVNQAAGAQQAGSVGLHVAEHGAMHSVKDGAAGGRIDVPCVSRV